MIPLKKPIVAGIQAIFPCSSAISMDGMSKDQTEAAIITPEANPKSNFSILLFSLFLIKNTIPAPTVVPKNGINNPINNCIQLPLSIKIILLFFIMVNTFFSWLWYRVTVHDPASQSVSNALQIMIYH